MEITASSPDLLHENPTGYGSIRDSIRTLYLADPRPWLVGFSGGKDSTMVASLIVEVVADIHAEQHIERSLQ